MDLFELNGRVVVNLTDAVKAFNEIQKEGQKTESKLGKFFSGVGKAAGACGKAIATGLAAGATAMVALTGKALQLSGELEQNMGGAEAVFGDLGDSIDKMSTTIITGYDEATGKAIKSTMSLEEVSENAYKNMGLSTSDYLATANKMGALFKGAGFDTQKALDLSSSAMQRAADVASIMGIDTSAAMEAIAGAAKGNFTMMDNLGVAMNDTAIQNYALSKGIKKATKDMTQQEKIGLAMEMFMEKTAYAAGNYAKENETLAGSLGTAKSALTNFLDGSGDVESLVSSVSNLANVVVRSLKDILPRLTSGLRDLVKQIVPLIPPLLQELLPAIVDGAVVLVNGVVEALPMIIDALMGALPELINGIKLIVNSIILALPEIIETLVAAIPTLIPILVDALVSMIVMLCTMLPQIIQPIIDHLPDIIISLIDALMSNLPALIQGLITLILGIVTALPQIIQGLVDALPTAITIIIDTLIQNIPMLIDAAIQIVLALVQALPQIIMSLVTALPSILGPVWEGIVNVFSSLPEWFGQLWEGVTGIFTTVWNGIANFLGPLLNGIGSLFSSIWNGITSAVSTAVNVVWNVVSSVFNAVWNTISGVWNGIWNTISGVVNGIRNTISNVFNSVWNTVTNIFNGIKNAISAPIEKAKEIVGGIVNAIKGFFNFKIEFPKIKLPHLSIKPNGWQFGDLFKGVLPSIGIDWYAKAMNNPMLMTDPTVFGYDAATGHAKVGGEAGDEIVGGANTIMNMIRAAVADQNSAVAYYLQKLIDILASYFPQVLEAMDRDIVLDSGAMVGAMVVPMNQALGTLSDRKDRGR